MRRTTRVRTVAGIATAAGLAVAAALGGGSAAVATATHAPLKGNPQGADISYLNTAASVDTAVTRGAKFLFIEATETDNATSSVPNLDSSKFAAQWAEAGKKKVLHGAYVVADQGNGKGTWSPAAQSATHFANLVSSHYTSRTEGYVLPPVIDLEGGTTTKCWVTSNAAWNAHKTAYQADMVKWVRTYVETVQSKLGRAPIIYTNANWWSTCTGNSKAFASSKLWVASWGSTAKPSAMPGGWSNWLFWQWRNEAADGAGAFPGDQDVFNGSAAALNAYTTPLAHTPKVSIAGTAKTGSTLTAKVTSVDSGVTLAYKWYMNGRVISGGVKPTQKLNAQQNGTSVTVTVTATRPGYVTAVKTSAPVKVSAGPVSAGTPTITGAAPHVGTHLQVSTGNWTAGTKFSYQWYANGKAIAGATSYHFTPGAAQKGTTLTARVTGSLTGYTSVTKTTAKRGPVLP